MAAITAAPSSSTEPASVVASTAASRIDAVRHPKPRQHVGVQDQGPQPIPRREVAPQERGRSNDVPLRRTRRCATTCSGRSRDRQPPSGRLRRGWPRRRAGRCPGRRGCARPRTWTARPEPGLLSRLARPRGCAAAPRPPPGSPDSSRRCAAKSRMVSSNRYRMRTPGRARPGSWRPGHPAGSSRVLRPGRSSDGLDRREVEARPGTPRGGRTRRELSSDEQPIAPLDGRGQRGVPLPGLGAPADQQREPVVETVDELAGGSGAAAGQRRARWPGAARRDARTAPTTRGSSVSTIPGPAAADAHAPTKSSADSGPSDPIRCSASPSTRSGSRLVTRTRARAARIEDRVDQLGAGVQQVLAVVQHQQHRRVPRLAAREAVWTAPSPWMPADSATARMTPVSIAHRRQLGQDDLDASAAVRSSAWTARATARAKVDLPAPPGPVIVTIRCSRSSADDRLQVGSPADQPRPRCRQRARGAAHVRPRCARFGDRRGQGTSACARSCGRGGTRLDAQLARGAVSAIAVQRRQRGLATPGVARGRAPAPAAPLRRAGRRPRAPRTSRRRAAARGGAAAGCSGAARSTARRGRRAAGPRCRARRRSPAASAAAVGRGGSAAARTPRRRPSRSAPGKRAIDPPRGRRRRASERAPRVVGRLVQPRRGRLDDRPGHRASITCSRCSRRPGCERQQLDQRGGLPTGPRSRRHGDAVHGDVEPPEQPHLDVHSGLPPSASR